MTRESWRSRAGAGQTLNDEEWWIFWQRFHTALGCLSRTRRCTHISHLNWDPCWKDTPAYMSLFCLHSSRFTVLFFHIKTQPLSLGNWMWQEILGGLLAGYQVNLWNVTHLTPAGWLWHRQKTHLNHCCKQWRLNTRLQLFLQRRYYHYCQVIWFMVHAKTFIPDRRYAATSILIVMKQIISVSFLSKNKAKEGYCSHSSYVDKKI